MRNRGAVQRSSTSRSCGLVCELEYGISTFNLKVLSYNSVREQGTGSSFVKVFERSGVGGLFRSGRSPRARLNVSAISTAFSPRPRTPGLVFYSPISVLTRHRPTAAAASTCTNVHRPACIYVFDPDTSAAGGCTPDGATRRPRLHSTPPYTVHGMSIPMM